jgi:oligoendopeptidase F
MAVSVTPLERHFVPKDLTLASWDDMKPYADDLLARPLDTSEQFEQWLQDWNEVTTILSEDFEIRYVRMSCHTADEALRKAYETCLENIFPQASVFDNAIQERLLNCPFSEQKQDKAFQLWLRGLRLEKEIFRTENLPLQTEVSKMGSCYGEIVGSKSVTLDGVKMTLPQASGRLFNSDRTIRETTWRTLQDETKRTADELNNLYDSQVKLRHQMALNAGEENYRDYTFKQLKRYDYTPQECFAYHDAVEKHVLPIIESTLLERKKALQLDALRPWDLSCDAHGRAALSVCKDIPDLIEKSYHVLHNTDPLLGDTLRLLQQADRLDLETRPNKQMNGYMMGMHESRVPFIFMNATDRVDDAATLLHEVGHAAHQVLSDPLRQFAYRNFPSEAAELASMSLELITLDEWHIYFPIEEECRRAKLEHLEHIIIMMPWMMIIDAFQHEVYTHPDWTVEQRLDSFERITKRFSTSVVDWSGFEQPRRIAWHKQMHIFEMPFYYIEYAIAQLGALQVWRNFKQDKKQAMAQYKHALSLAYTVPLPEIYAAAGVKFDFSSAVINDLMQFVSNEIKALR